MRACDIPRVDHRKPQHPREPPGCYVTIIEQPRSEDESMEVAVFSEHRFAFFYWTRWTKRFSSAPPDLVSLDYHTDTAPPCADVQHALSQLDLSNETQVALAAWLDLHPHNDSHILSAAYLNLIGDIYVLQKQGDALEPEEFTDVNGNVHVIYVFETEEDLIAALRVASSPDVYFDVDIDFFTHYADDAEEHVPVPVKEVRAVLDTNGPLLRWVLPRVRGMTIALEPEYCGGLRGSHGLFNAVDDLLFFPGLGRGDCAWRHQTGEL